MYNIEILERLTKEDAEDFAILLPQLSKNAEFDYGRMCITVLSKTSTVFVARDKQYSRIMGSLTLVCYSLPTGLKAWIEDVVVDVSCRGHGIGKALCKKAIAHAQALGYPKVDLTSKPTRKAANMMYQSIGFQQRETNVYRLKLES